jgi:hypothetical protein
MEMWTFSSQDIEATVNGITPLMRSERNWHRGTVLNQIFDVIMDSPGRNSSTILFCQFPHQIIQEFSTTDWAKNDSISSCKTAKKFSVNYCMNVWYRRRWTLTQSCYVESTCHTHINSVLRTRASREAGSRGPVERSNQSGLSEKPRHECHVLIHLIDGCCWNVVRERNLDTVARGIGRREVSSDRTFYDSPRAAGGLEESPTHSLNTRSCFAEADWFHSLENWIASHGTNTRWLDHGRTALWGWSANRWIGSWGGCNLRSRMNISVNLVFTVILHVSNN